jgi:hypothetical protein
MKRNQIKTRPFNTVFFKEITGAYVKDGIAACDPIFYGASGDSLTRKMY